MLSVSLAVDVTLMLNMASVLIIISADDHMCKHTITEHQEVFYDVDIEPSHRVKRSAAYRPLRITLYFDASVDELPLEHTALIKTKVQKAVQFWQETLKVRATESPIRLRRQCTTQSVDYHNQRAYCQNKCASYTQCGEIVIPNDHLEACYYTFTDSKRIKHFEILNNAGPGVENTDFILYIASFRSDRCERDRTVAYAAHCQQERGLDRPVAGYFSICPNSISDSWQERQQLLSTMKHEILHALGFTAGLYAFYRDADGNPLTERNDLTGRPTLFDGQRAMFLWSDRVVKNFTRTDWKIHTGVTNRVVMMMVTPKVVEEVRRHFDCPILEGAELEDQGIDGTAITHWEKRVFENEAMTGTYTQNSVISRITLAMMEDTGWYKADYSKADNYEWGRGLGCDFVQKSCYHWISTRLARNESIYPFCRRVKRGELLTDCTPNRHAVALCNLIEYEPELAVQYQYFLRGQLDNVDEGKEGHFGGSVVLADYCPYFQEFSWTHGEKILRGSSCLVPANSMDPVNNFFGEYYGEDSRCFKHGGLWYLYKCGRENFPQHTGSSCYKVKCENDSGLSIVINRSAYPCYHKGYVHKVTLLPGSGYLHKGSIVCPACSEICPEFNVQCPPDRAPEPLPVVDLPVPCLGTWAVPDINLLVSLLCVHFVTLRALDCFFTFSSSKGYS